MKLQHILAFCLAFAAVSAAKAEPFSSKDRINMIVGYEVGGGYDIYARFLSRHMGRHLEGNPTFIVQNMPGAGSLRAANFIYNVAPKDGTTIGTVSQSVAMMQLLETPGLQFEVDKFSWIGRVSDVDTVLGVWHAAGVKSIQETKTKQITVAVGGALSGSDLYVKALNALVGTKIRPISGYGAKPAQLAMERQEVDGSFSILFNQLRIQQPTWISEDKLRVLVQIGTERRSNLPNVPTLTELAANEDDRRILAVLSSGDIVGRTILGPSNMQKDRLTLLRRAFDATMADQVAVAEAAKLQLDLNPLSGEKLQDLLSEYKELSPALITRIKNLAEDK